MNKQTSEPDLSTIPGSRPRTGSKIRDFISGKLIPAGPEEVEAVQVFSRRLVEDFGYPKDVIQTRPQFRVRRRPSGAPRKGYPVDIAVFNSPQRLESEALILVECKRRTRTDGEAQLKLYLTMSSAELGVWFNGQEHLYLQKVYEGGQVLFRTLPTLPRFGQSIGDIGSLKRRELVVPHDMKAIFRDLRNHLAGNTTGITRDQSFAQEIINVLFCKIYDELDTAPDDIPGFRAAPMEAPERVADRVARIFGRVRDEYPDVFHPTDRIQLDATSLCYVVGELQSYLISGASRDAVGDAFEVFIGPAIRGEEGQFFTPRNVVEMMITILDPSPSDSILDPACGSGGFLIVALEHLWQALEREAQAKNWTEAQLERRKRNAATRCIRGIDKDAFLTKVTKAYMAIVGDGRSGVFCEDSLERAEKWRPETKAKIPVGSFDIVVTNPPFGSKIKVTGDDKLRQYELARVYRRPSAKRPEWEATTRHQKKQSPQILFIERCVQFLRPGGKLAIVLPESIFGMPSYGYVVKYLMENFVLRGFVSLPEEVFQPHTHAKTCVVFLENTAPAGDYEIEMAIADWCGHDSRGNPTVRTGPDGSTALLDDIPEIAERLHELIEW